MESDIAELTLPSGKEAIVCHSILHMNQI